MCQECASPWKYKLKQTNEKTQLPASGQLRKMGSYLAIPVYVY